jgi:hypothetical protein
LKVLCGITGREFTVSFIIALFVAEIISKTIYYIVYV